MIYETPKEPKRRNQVIKRLMSPKTTIIGLLLIGLGMWVLNMNLEETTRLTIALLLFGMGGVSLGLKDK